jgi:hypothetical protein
VIKLTVVSVVGYHCYQLHIKFYPIFFFQTLIDASKEVGLDVNTEETKYMLLSRHQNAGQNHDIKIGNRCFENVTQFKYFGTTIPKNFIQKELERRLNSGNACYHSAQNLLSLVCCLKT